MEIKKKLELLEEMMDLDTGTLNGEEVLEDLEDWDSMTALSFILLLSDEFDKTITGADIKKLHTVHDMMALMEKDA